MAVEICIKWKPLESPILQPQFYDVSHHVCLIKIISPFVVAFSFEAMVDCAVSSSATFSGPVAPFTPVATTNHVFRDCQMFLGGAHNP